MQELDPGAEKSRPGSVKGQSFRVVCRACNSGWMSQLEGSVRPFLEPMMKGQALLLDETALSFLRRWMAMKLMVAEFYGGRHAVLLPADRAMLRAGGKLPANMTIRLGKCAAPDWQTALVVQSAGLWLKHLAPASQAMLGPNIQTTTMGYGQVYVHSVVRRPAAPDIDLGLIFKVGLLQLWPSTPKSAYWPPAGGDLSTDDAEMIARRLQDHIRRPQTTWHASPRTERSSERPERAGFGER
jgi:hypothetical protein